MTTIKGLLLAGVFICSLATGTAAIAGGDTRMNVVAGERQAGKLRDGEVIGQGYIASQGSHSGFQVWSDALKSGGQPERYVLGGVQDGKHQLRVRIQGNGWSPDNSGGRGIIDNTGNNVATFNVVVDGDQFAGADRYLLNLSGEGINPAMSGSDGDVVTKMLAVNLTQVRMVKHELKTVLSRFNSHLQDNTLLAEGRVSLADLLAQGERIAVRFTPGIGVRGSDGDSRVISGRNDSQHVLKVKLQMAESAVSAGADDWRVSNSAVTAVDYRVVTDGRQDAAADIYIISVESGVWSD